MSTLPLIHVCARKLWNRTGVQLTAGTRYRVEVPPGQTWTDWWIKYGPEGGTRGLQHLTARWLRVKGDETGRAEYFTLIGTIGESLDHAFVIGKGPREFIAPISGEFVCFANDLENAYWNNRGSMTLTIASMS